MIDELTITTTPELGVIANHSLVRLCLSHDTERYIFSEYFAIMQQKSETLLSIMSMIEKWRTTPYDVLFEEMRA